METHSSTSKCLENAIPNESDFEMYEAQFADGHKAHVFADELMHTRQNFERPDYKALERSTNKTDHEFRTRFSN